MHDIRYAWLTRFRGIGGTIKSPEDFSVTEVIRQRRFGRSAKGVAAVSGPYSLYLLEKRNVNTADVIDEIKKITGRHEIGYAGLKDRFAVTSQYVTIKNPPVSDIDSGSFTLKHAGFYGNMLHAGDLLENRFSITLRGASCSDIGKKITTMSHGIPNYFGPQRFGIRADNHEKGLEILKGRLKTKKDAAKFYIHAYQSWLFNEALAQYVENGGKPFFSMVRIPGFMTRPGRTALERTMRILMQGDDISENDFRVDALHLSCAGTVRVPFVRPRIQWKQEGNSLILSFSLPPGSYATAVLGELCKPPKSGYSLKRGRKNN